MSLEFKSFNHPTAFGTIGMSSTSSKNLSQPIFFQEMNEGFCACDAVKINNNQFHFLQSGSLHMMPRQFSQDIDLIFASESLLLSNDHSKVLLIKYLLDPQVPRSEKNVRTRYRPSEFKCLNAMYQLRKNLECGRWTVFGCGKKKIGNTKQKIGRKSVTKFVCGEGLLFFKKTSRYKATNIYDMHDWVIECFEFFEKKGMMHAIIDDFRKWRKVFLKRLDHWLLPLLEKGHTLKEILLNKLSTKKPLKGAYPNTLKGAGIKLPSEGSHKAFQGSKSNTESPLPFSDFNKVGDNLARFSLRQGDIRVLMIRFSLSHHKRACSLYELWRERGMKIDSPVRVYQTCLNKTKDSQYGRK